eukprot:4317054-Alexandrium_andersonii.AAC.1
MYVADLLPSAEVHAAVAPYNIAIADCFRDAHGALFTTAVVGVGGVGEGRGIARGVADVGAGVAHGVARGVVRGVARAVAHGVA